MALSRSPTPAEEAAVQEHLKSCSGCDSASQGAEKLGWLLMNLDEFLFVR